MRLRLNGVAEKKATEKLRSVAFPFFCFLPTAYCPLPTAYCLLPSAHSPLCPLPASDFRHRLVKPRSRGPSFRDQLSALVEDLQMRNGSDAILLSHRRTPTIDIHKQHLHIRNLCVDLLHQRSQLPASRTPVSIKINNADSALIEIRLEVNVLARCVQRLCGWLWQYTSSSGAGRHTCGNRRATSEQNIFSLKCSSITALVRNRHRQFRGFGASPLPWRHRRSILPQPAQLDSGSFFCRRINHAFAFVKKSHSISVKPGRAVANHL